LDVRSKFADVKRTVEVFDIKSLATEEKQIHGFCREEEPYFFVTQLQGPEKEDLLQTSLMQECFNFKS